MATKKQYYDIKFPFTANNLDGFFIDLNNNIDDKKASEIIHVLLTPKRSRIRQPNFGTDLVKYIFEPNDSKTWEGIRGEIMDSVNNYVSGVNITNVGIIRKDGENDNNIYVSVEYQVTTSKTPNNKQLVVKL